VEVAILHTITIKQLVVIISSFLRMYSIARNKLLSAIKGNLSIDYCTLDILKMAE